MRRTCIPIWLAITFMLASAPGQTQTPATRDPSSRDSPVEARSYVDYSLPELQKAVPQLHGLQPDPNQDQLRVLLTKAGNVVENLLGKTPNLLSREHVEHSEMEEGNSSNSKRVKRSRPRDFDYLTLVHEDLINVRTEVEEYRIDPEGRPIEPGAEDSRNPSSRGFKNVWLLFLPYDQSQSKFHYLGRQQFGDHGTFVVAFAQTPDNVQVPGKVRFQGGRMIPVFWQGIAWIEESTFRIVCLRSDLLDPIPSIHLQQLTSQLQFDDTNVSGVASPLWLPREVDITTRINGQIVSEIHRYWNYRLYAVSSKIVPAP